MKYMILINASQRDYDAMTGRPSSSGPGWTPDDFAALGAFMESFNHDLAESGELVDTRGLTAPADAGGREGRRRHPRQDRPPALIHELPDPASLMSATSTVEAR